MEAIVFMYIESKTVKLKMQRVGWWLLGPGEKRKWRSDGQGYRVSAEQEK